MALTRSLALAHLEQARSNYRLYQRLKGEGDHLDWAATLLFYTALQLAQAYLVEVASDGFDYPRGHTDRESFIRRRIPEIFEPFRFLETRSRWARYHQDRPDPTVADLDQYERSWFTPVVDAMSKRGVSLVESEVQSS